MKKVLCYAGPACVLSALVIAGLLLHPGAGRGGASAPAPSAPADESPKPLAVTTTQPKMKTLKRKIEQPGDIHADEQAPIYARISGFVKQVEKGIDIGSEVKEGQVLAELSVPEMDEELKQKTALVGQAKAEVTLANALHRAAIEDAKSSRAKVGEAESSKERYAAELRRTESQWERLKKSSGVVGQEVLDEAKLGFEAARAAMAEVDARIKSAQAVAIATEAREAKAKADIEVAESRQRVAEADERRTAALVGYAKLKAPFPGIVTRRNIDAGHFLQPGQGGGNTGAAFVVARIDPVRVYIDVPENDARLVRVGMKATITVPGLNQEEFTDKVTRTSWALDPKVRTLRVEVDLKNAGRRLRPGTYVMAVLHSERDVLTVPASAILTQGEQHFCFLYQQGKAVRTQVKVGLRDDTDIEVTRRKVLEREDEWAPFTTGDRVITNHLANLKDGQAVTGDGS